MPHVITLTGPSGSGKSTAVAYFLANATDSFRPKLVAKYTTRSPRDDDGEEVICVERIPAHCDLVYEQYEVRYGLALSWLFDLVADGFSPIVILNDVRAVEDVRTSLRGLVRSVFIFREGPSPERYRELAQLRGVVDEKDAERRFRKSQAIYRKYIENIHLFDHVILNSGTRTDLRMQVKRIIRGLNQDPNWPMRENRR